MKKLGTISYSMFTISVVCILYALIFSPPKWIVYGISIVFIPMAILSFGLILMARSTKEEEEERKREPFIGY